MRRVAIASLVVPLIGLYALYKTYTRLIPADRNMPGTVYFEDVFHHEMALVVLSVTIGLACSLLVFLAPLFGRPRVGVPYAVAGFSFSIVLLALLLIAHHAA